MRAFPGYAFGARLHEGPSTVLFRATREDGSGSVLIRALRDDSSADDHVAALRHEFEVTRGLDAKGVLRPVALERSAGGLALVFEDFEGEPLTALLAGHRLDVATALEIGVRAAEALGEIHRAEIVHRNVQPASLLVSLGPLATRLTDFSSATQVPRERREFGGETTSGIPLAYVSPEQTGRTNRSVDYRTDLYSLGVTLYEMLTGRPPFEGEDALEIVHQHLARAPVPPHELEAGVPESASRIVLKLLEKRPEDRYQSAFGLRKDLEASLADWRRGARSELDPGARDVPQRLQIPERLYGRDRETQQLLEAFDRVAAGATEYFLVGGYSGVGKSALVHEIHQPISRRRGHFVWGKFDQFRRDTPYSALIEAFSTLMRQVLTLPTREIDRFRERVEESLGDALPVMVEMIPDLAMIVGEQPPAPELPPTEAQIRFNLAFQRFVSAIASAERPVAIFVDDLQWADSATLNLMQTVTVSPDTRHVLFLGAYRDNEVTVHHPLVLAIAQLRKTTRRVSEIVLQPLGRDDVERLIADALASDVETVRSLAAIVHAKTDGNPFYLGQFLRALEHEGLLSFDFDTGRWMWDVDRIQAAETTANVVELMVAKIRRLPSPTQSALQLAACIGNRFDLDTLGIVSETTPAEAGRRIWPAVREGLLLPMGEAYRDVPDEDHAWAEEAVSGRRVTFRFLHDRVQQAAGALMDEDEVRRVHLRIGRLLLEETPEAEREERLFDIVDHLNTAVELVREPAFRLELCRLNLQAGAKARVSSAFAPAARYLEAGIDLLPDGAWDTEYDLALGLHLAAAEAHYMCLDPARGNALGDVVLEHARTALDRVPIYELRIQLLVTQGRMRDAVLLALEPLEMLGVTFPSKPNDLHALWHFGRTWLRIRKRSMQELLDRPRMQDAEKLAAMRVLMRVISAAYQGARELFPLLVLTQIDLTLEHGNSPHSSYAYGAFATTIWVVLGDLQRTYDFGKLGRDLAMRFPDKDLQAREIFMFNTFQRHWKEPQRVCCDRISYSARLAVEGGDLEYFAYGTYHSIWVSFFAGHPLGEIGSRLESARGQLTRLDMEQAMPMVRIGLQMTSNLTGRHEGRALLEGTEYRASEEKRRMLEIGHFSAVYYAHLAGTILAYLFGDHERAVNEAEAAEEHLGNVMAMIVIPGLNLFQSLACVAAARRARGRRRSALVSTVRRNQKRLRKWAAAAACNFGHKHDLVAAELAGLEGDSDRASALYDAAIRAARAEGFPNEEAVAAECAALHYLRQERRTIASAYMREAVDAYVAWGATAKVHALREEHPELLRREVSARTAASDTDGDGSGLASLDLAAVMGASQAVSQEIVLDRLLARLMKTVLQSAGADRGALVRVDEGDLVVEAVGDEAGVRVVPDEPVAAGAHVAASAVGLVARTGEVLVLDDASASPDHASDPHFAADGERSVLAVPMKRHDEVVGVLYVENTLSTGAFTEDRVEVLRLLATQAAISLENARLYTNLATLNRAYERFVPRAFLQFLAKKSITDVELGDHVRRDVTVLFADIRSFTALSESMTPEDNFRFLNSFLGRMEPIVLRHGGFIDKYMGDAIMALFEGPTDAPLRAAIEMIRSLREHNEVRAERGHVPIRIGIGINSGPTMLGTVGGHERMDGTVIGDTVNTAGRIEGLTRHFGSDILVSQATLERLAHPQHYRSRSLGRVRVHGKQDWEALHEVFEGDPPDLATAKERTRDRVEEGLRLFHGRDPAAAAAVFREILEEHADDRAVRFLLHRAETAQRDRLSETWDGSLGFDRK